ncbi:MAG: RHS repeat-associated core domain-containing protein [Deltaproteobacteria bacterium]|nr:RHS repeat-associated core domain-containing protein [Deltaproteobacteria bacterium]
MKRWLVSIGWVGVVAWQMASGEVIYFHSDHLGSTAVVSNSSGAVQQIECYTPFGETVIVRERSDRSNLPTNHLYTNQEFNHESTLYDYGARYYDPALSRFVSVDPVLDSPNPYAYVAGNPVQYRDPTGEIRDDIESIYDYASGMATGSDQRTFIVEVDASGLWEQNDYLGEIAGDDYVEDAKAAVRQIEGKAGLEAIHPHGAGSDEWYWVTHDEKQAGEIASRFRKDVWSVNSAEVTSKSPQEVSDIVANFSKKPMHSLMKAQKARYRKLAERAVEGVTDPQERMAIRRAIAKRSRLAMRRTAEALIKNGFWKGATDIGKKVVPGVSIACGLQCLAEGDAFGAFLNFAGEFPPPFGPAADYFSIIYAVEGDPSYRSPYLVGNGCPNNRCHGF